MKETTRTEEPFYMKLHRREAPTRLEFHQHFGGIIYNYDFDIRYKENDPVKEESEIAARIMRDYARENTILRNRYFSKKYANFNIDSRD